MSTDQIEEIAREWVQENVRPDQDTWLAQQAFEDGFKAGNSDMRPIVNDLWWQLCTLLGHGFTPTLGFRKYEEACAVLDKYRHLIPLAKEGE